GVGVRFSVGGDRKLDVSAVRPPKGYVDSKLSMERLADSAGIGSANGTPRALWHTEDQPGRVIFLFSDNKPGSGGDAEQVDELKRALNESGRPHDIKREEVRSVGKYRFAVVEAVRSDGIRLEYATTNIGNEVWAVGAVAREAEAEAQARSVDAALEEI